MRILTILTVVVLLLSSTFLLADEGKANFSGQWILNKDKSELGDTGGRRRGRAATKLVIEQKDNKLVVESFRLNRDGEEASRKLTYTLDGKESKNEMNFGDQVATANWSKDGKTLTIESTMTISRGDRDFTIESTDKWSLDGDTLTIGSVRTTPRGERKSKAVYNKAEKKK